jgi:hypothetical protein
MSFSPDSAPRPFAVIEAALMKEGFTAFQDSQSLMNELAALPPKGRSGIYVHFFAGAEEWFYLGLSVDVRQRYYQHIKNHTDIIKTAWLPAPRENLVALELKYLSLMQEHQAQLRNILKHREDYRWEDFQDVFDDEKANAWLMDPYQDRTDYDVVDKELEANYAKRFATLEAHPDFREDHLDIINYYLRNFVFDPAHTAQMFWNVTCLTNGGYEEPFDKLTALLRINIHMPEVFTLILNEDYPGQPRLTFNFHVAADHFSEEDLARFEKTFGGQPHPGNYRATGGPQCQFQAADVEGVWALFRDPAFRIAAKVSNIRLMRQGLLARRLSQSHCLPLAKAALSRPIIWLAD